MRLEQMFKNVLDYSLEALTLKVEEYSARRAERIMQSMSKIYIAPKAQSSSTKLSDAEKGILKALGLSIKDIKALKGAMDG